MQWKQMQGRLLGKGCKEEKALLEKPNSAKDRQEKQVMASQWHKEHDGEIDASDYDALRWVTLSEHEDDLQLCAAPSCTACWKLGGETSSDGESLRASSPSTKQRPTSALLEEAEALKGFYRFVRLVVTGPNSSSNLSLALGAIELYGNLQEISPAKSLSFPIPLDDGPLPLPISRMTEDCASSPTAAASPAMPCDPVFSSTLGPLLHEAAVKRHEAAAAVALKLAEATETALEMQRAEESAALLRIETELKKDVTVEAFEEDAISIALERAYHAAADRRREHVLAASVKRDGTMALIKKGHRRRIVLTALGRLALHKKVNGYIFSAHLLRCLRKWQARQRAQADETGLEEALANKLEEVDVRYAEEDVQEVMRVKEAAATEAKVRRRQVRTLMETPYLAKSSAAAGAMVAWSGEATTPQAWKPRGEGVKAAARLGTRPIAEYFRGAQIQAHADKCGGMRLYEVQRKEECARKRRRAAEIKQVKKGIVDMEAGVVVQRRWMALACRVELELGCDPLVKMLRKQAARRTMVYQRDANTYLTQMLGQAIMREQTQLRSFAQEETEARRVAEAARDADEASAFERRELERAQQWAALHEALAAAREKQHEAHETQLMDAAAERHRAAVKEEQTVRELLANRQKLV
jgi:hypothetical protein